MVARLGQHGGERGAPGRDVSLVELPRWDAMECSRREEAGHPDEVAAPRVLWLPLEGLLPNGVRVNRKQEQTNQLSRVLSPPEVAACGALVLLPWTLTAVVP